MVVQDRNSFMPKNKLQGLMTPKQSLRLARAAPTAVKIKWQIFVPTKNDRQRAVDEWRQHESG